MVFSGETDSALSLISYNPVTTKHFRALHEFQNITAVYILINQQAVINIKKKTESYNYFFTKGLKGLKNIFNKVTFCDFHLIHSCFSLKLLSLITKLIIHTYHHSHHLS